MALALHLPVGELQRRMSSVEFAEWLAYLELEPLPDEALQAQMAQLIALLANVYRDRKRSKVYTTDDFIPRIKPEPRARSWQDQKAQFKALTQALTHGNH